MKNFALLGSDGREYEVVVVIDNRTGKLLKQAPFALVATEALFDGASTESLVPMNDPRVEGLARVIDERVQNEPGFLESLRKVFITPL
jgi:hypothetical protein